MSGFIALHRELLDWEWYSDANTKCLFIHCLLKANWQDKKWEGIIIQRGSFVTGRKQLCKETGLSEMQVRTCLKKLQQTNNISVKVTNKFSVITVVKYEEYQSLTPADNQQVTSKQPANNQQITTTNKVNNIKQSKESLVSELKARKQIFAKTLEPFLNVYGKEMLNDFYLYWTEDTREGYRFKQELQETWSLERRLKSWHSREKNKKKSPGAEKSQPVAGRQTEETIKHNLEAFMNYGRRQ